MDENYRGASWRSTESLTFCLGVAPLLVAFLAAPVLALDEKIAVDAKNGTVTVPAVVAQQGLYKVLKGAVEYVLVSTGGKDYETLFTTAAKPEELRDAFKSTGLEAGKPAAEGAAPRGMAVAIFAEYEVNGKKVRRAVDEFVLRKATGRPLKPRAWTFTGSVQGFDPEADREVLQCLVTKSIVGLHYSDASPLFQNARPEAKTENIYKANVGLLPKAGTKVRIIFERVRPKLVKGTKRVHVFVSGRVQGVGFRAFTQREARRLKLTGFVRNLEDGRVEAIIEGPGKNIEKLLTKLKRGPRAARVEKLEDKKEAPRGDFRAFNVRY